MSATEFLNLDDVAPPSRFVTIGGEKYAVLDMTVENFIETTRAQKDIEDQPEEVKMEKTIEMLARFIPDAGDAVLRKLTFEKLNVLVAFVNGNLEREASDKEQPAVEGKSAKKQK